MKKSDKVCSMLTELQMLTGVVSEDISYLYYLLVKDGTMFEQETTPTHKDLISDVSVMDVNDWFNSL